MLCVTHHIALFNYHHGLRRESYQFWTARGKNEHLRVCSWLKTLFSLSLVFWVLLLNLESRCLPQYVNFVIRFAHLFSWMKPNKFQQDRSRQKPLSHNQVNVSYISFIVSQLLDDPKPCIDLVVEGVVVMFVIQYWMLWDQIDKCWKQSWNKGFHWSNVYICRGENLLTYEYSLPFYLSVIGFGPDKLFVISGGCRWTRVMDVGVFAKKEDGIRLRPPSNHLLVTIEK